ncbi:MAG: DUF1801 domain-containing protein [Chloroflexota bacterium]|nr:DUF1801 domain-containing protein [Anaerolineae bacterium]
MSPTVEQFLSTYPQDVQELALKTRELVKAIVPDVREQVYEAYKTIGYGSGTKVDAMFCYIAPLKDRINLGFYRGVVLKDADGLLEGTGKLLRHVKVRSMAEVEKPALRQLIVEAVAELERVSSVSNHAQDEKAD